MSGASGSDPFTAQLGPLHTVQLSAGPLRYRDQGGGVPVVFLAGLVLSSGFWRRLVPALTQPVRAIVPDLPLGAHTVPYAAGLAKALGAERVRLSRPRLRPASGRGGLRREPDRGSRAT